MVRLHLILNSKSGYRNVTKEGDKFGVRINNKRYGRFDSFEEAKEHADTMRKKIYPQCERI